MNETSLRPIGEVLPGLLETIGVTSKNFAVASIAESELNQVSPSAKIVGFKQGKIYVEVDSSAELQELSLRKPEILKAIHDAFPIDALRSPVEIKFFLRGLARPAAASWKSGAGSKRSANFKKPCQN